MRKNFLEFFGTLGPLTVGYLIWGWTDYYHGAIGGLALVGFCLLARRIKNWQHRRKLPPRARNAANGQLLVRGAMKGVVCFGLLGAIFPLMAAYTPIEEWVYGQHCPAVLEKITTLREAGAWKGMADSIDRHLPEKAPGCRTKLLQQKSHALVGWATQLPGEERIKKLEEAEQVVRELKDPELSQLVTAELQVARAKVEVARKDEALRQTSEALDQNQKLLAEFRKGLFDASETNEGIVVKLSDNASNLYFEPGSADLTPATRTMVAKVADILNQRDVSARTVKIKGYTDSTGKPDQNLTLSRQRAWNVEQALLEHGVRRERLTVDGFGATHPIAPNDTAEGRAKNRRVMIVIQN